MTRVSIAWSCGEFVEHQRRTDSSFCASFSILSVLVLTPHTCTHTGKKKSRATLNEMVLTSISKKCVSMKQGAVSESSASYLPHLLLSELPALVLSSLVSLGKFTSWTSCCQEPARFTFHFRMLPSPVRYSQCAGGAGNGVSLFGRERALLRRPRNVRSFRGSAVCNFASVSPKADAPM